MLLDLFWKGTLQSAEVLCVTFGALRRLFKPSIVIWRQFSFFFYPKEGPF